jgi:hypothetical protein
MRKNGNKYFILKMKKYIILEKYFTMFIKNKKLREFKFFFI